MMQVNIIKFMTVTGIFSALSVILYVVVPDFGLGFTPFWLKVHLDEIPMFLAGYMYGPLAAIVVNLIKMLIKLPMTTTACVGEFGDFFYLMRCCRVKFVCRRRRADSQSACYKKRNKKHFFYHSPLNS